MPQSWRTVRVFISSTFRDMQAERDHLVCVVFPRLREESVGYEWQDRSAVAVKEHLDGAAHGDDASRVVPCESPGAMNADGEDRLTDQAVIISERRVRSVNAGLCLPKPCSYR
jgi:hypothetical protein